VPLSLTHANPARDDEPPADQDELVQWETADGTVELITRREWHIRAAKS
jgi:hypothetical protein